MKWRDEIRVPVKVIGHLNGGFTQLLVLAGSQPFMTDVATERIPAPLRRTSSRFCSFDGHVFLKTTTQRKAFDQL